MNEKSNSNMDNYHILNRTTSRTEPEKIEDKDYMFPAFSNGFVLLNKKKGRLPAMGWNSWNAFGSKNSEKLTKEMVEAIIQLELAELGYQYVVLDDGCYQSERVEGLLSNEPLKFPSGFKALSDYIHEKGLKFGMYNDIGTRLCAGSAVGTCGFEDRDTKTYIDWGIDFIKVDNCYYLWDNATFSDESNAKFTYAPKIRSITISGDAVQMTLNAVNDGILLGRGGLKEAGDCVSNIGTFDGTNVGTTPIGDRFSELAFQVSMQKEGTYKLVISYASGEENGTGCWLQIAVGTMEKETRYLDELLPPSKTSSEFITSREVIVYLQKGENTIRLMNHRRQENTLHSYATLLAGFNNADPNHDIIFSICEWGKTQPQNWGYKIGDSWRILNDITFCVGTDGDRGSAAWSSNDTASITSQYNKTVIMDEFSGLDKGWNDPDMLVIGMDGITDTMCKTHMAMWCMMNAPLMLGMDLRAVKKGDTIWEIIANKELIALNQDLLGIQAKRIDCSLEHLKPDSTYIMNNCRVDILAKPLENGDVAISFINLDEENDSNEYVVDANQIIHFLGHKMKNKDTFLEAPEYRVKDLWSGEETVNYSGIFSVVGLNACGNVTLRITPIGSSK